MEIIRTSKQELTKKDIYRLSRSPEIEKMRDHVDETIPVGRYLIYKDANGNGEIVTVLSIEDRETGRVLASNSQTARDEFNFIADLMEEDGEAFDIKICEGTSKNGRKFITLAMV